MDSREFDKAKEPELPLIQIKRICSRCGKKEVYLDIETLDLCENCVYILSQSDSA